MEASKVMKISVAGKGKLMQQKIAKIHSNYSRAIYDSYAGGELCKRCIIVILLHMSSTDQNPKSLVLLPEINSKALSA